jgi:hypothetical protein
VSFVAGGPGGGGGRTIVWAIAMVFNPVNNDGLFEETTSQFNSRVYYICAKRVNKKKYTTWVVVSVQLRQVLSVKQTKKGNKTSTTLLLPKQTANNYCFETGAEGSPFLCLFVSFV